MGEEVAAPVEEITAPAEEITAPVEEITAPVEEITAPVEGITAPVEEITAPVEEIPAPVEEVVVESASSDSEPEKETVSEETFSLTEVSTVKEDAVKQLSAEEILAMKETKEESLAPALA